MHASYASRLGSIAVLGLTVSALLLACGASEVGERCDAAGSMDDCVDGSICTNEADDEARCRRICEEQEDCPAGEQCNGVAGSSTKSCQPDD